MQVYWPDPPPPWLLSWSGEKEAEGRRHENTYVDYNREEVSDVKISDVGINDVGDGEEDEGEEMAGREKELKEADCRVEGGGVRVQRAEQHQ